MIELARTGIVAIERGEM
ncbi:MAG: hypothetical protein IJT20_06570 [Synergistaceae bacterium]|nr:hypothetical protein [Synergistaceae bacterium]